MINQMNEHYPPYPPHSYGIPFFERLESEVYYLEYDDVYLKDSLLSQLAETYFNKGKMVLFVQQPSDQHTLDNLFLCRNLFKQNPHDYISLYQLTKDHSKISNYREAYEEIQPQSKHPKDFKDQMFQILNENSEIKLLVIDSHYDFLNSYNLYPSLKRLAFNNKIPILFTSKIHNTKMTESKQLRLTNMFRSAFLLESKIPDQISLSDNKEIVCEFEVLEINSKQECNRHHLTIRPSSGYIQEG